MGVVTTNFIYLCQLYVCGGRLIKGSVILTLAVIALCMPAFGQMTTQAWNNKDNTNETQSNLTANEKFGLVPYTDAQWNFTIQMPKGWTVGKGTNNNRQFTLFLSPNPERNLSGNIVFNENINIARESTNLGFDAYVTLSRQALARYLQDYRLIEERNVTLGVEAGKVIGETFTQDGLQVRSLQLFVQTGSSVYVVTASNLASEWDVDKDLIEASLMSFRPPS